MQDIVTIQTPEAIAQIAQANQASSFPVTPAPNQLPAQADAKAPAKGIQVTPRAVERIRSAMAKENISPEEGGLRLGKREMTKLGRVKKSKEVV